MLRGKGRSAGIQVRRCFIHSTLGIGQECVSEPASSLWTRLGGACSGSLCGSCTPYRTFTGAFAYRHFANRGSGGGSNSSCSRRARIATAAFAEPASTIGRQRVSHRSRRDRNHRLPSSRGISNGFSDGGRGLLQFCCGGLLLLPDLCGDRFLRLPDLGYFMLDCCKITQCFS